MNNKGKKITLNEFENAVENMDAGVNLENNGTLSSSTGNIEVDSHFNDIHNVNYSERQKAALEKATEHNNF
jgi:hypothetical protein